MSAQPDRDFIRRAVELADLDAVRVALHHQAPDPRLAALPTAARLSPDERSWLVGRTVDWLADHAGPRLSPEPHEAELRQLMDMAVGGPRMGDLEFAARRDLPSFKTFPFAAQWPGEKPAIPQGFTVVVIGSGFAGVTMGVQLDLLGIPYIVLERRNEPGGVWSINRYPDVRVDTASITYEFAFVKDYSWTEYFGRGAEVRNYVTAVSKRFGVYDKTRFGHDVRRAVFDEARDVWTLAVETPDGPRTLEANAIVSASGLFATPNIPEFEGRDDFQGRIVHPSQWPDDLDLAGKRVAVLGNGSTGVQILASIARQAAQVYVFQRTPQWIMPRTNYGKAVEPELDWLVKNFPGYWNWWRYTSTAPLFDTHELMQLDEEWKAAGGKVNPKSDAMREMLTGYIAQQVGDRCDLVEMLTPDYAPFSRRPVVDNGWYRALTRDNVELVTAGVARLTPNGVMTGEGRALDVDVIVSATGFHVAKYLWPAQYLGKGGVDLHARWDEGDGPRAYIGMMSPDFPNLFTLYGPNSQPISGGPAQPVWFSVWANFAAQGLMRMLETGASRIEVKRDAHDRYNLSLDAAAAKLVQMTAAGGVDKNYYVNAKHARLQVNAPWYSPEYHRLCTEVQWDDLVLSGLLAPRAPAATQTP